VAGSAHSYTVRANNTNGSSVYSTPAVADNAPSACALLPNLAASGPINYGNVPAGGPAVWRQVTITNSGGLNTNVTLSPPSSPLGTFNLDFSSFSLAANGGFKTVTLTFTPGAVANPLNNVNILVTGTNGANNLTIPVSGTVTAPVGTELLITRVGFPGVVGDPYSINIGAIPATAASRTFDFRIRKNTPLNTQYTVTIQGGTAIGYSLTSISGRGCGGTITNVNTEGVCRVTFNPDPAFLNARNATILFRNTTVGTIVGANPVRVNFSATVTDNPTAIVIPGANIVSSSQDPITKEYTIDFGPRSVNTNTVGRVNVANTGGQALSISNYTQLVQPHFSNIAPAFPVSVPSAGSHPIDITFRPTLAGAQPSRTITVQTNDMVNFVGGVITIHVLGSGITAPNLMVAPLALGFPDQDVSSGGITRTFTIRNTGTAPSDVVLSVVRTNANLGEFTVAPASRTIPDDGSTHTFTVTFDPDTVSAVSRTADIRIVPNNAGQITVSAWGKGIILPPSLNYDAPIDFGKVIVHKEKDKSTTVTSSDTRDLGAPSVLITGPDAAFFDCISGCNNITFPSTPPSVSRNIGLRFIPEDVRQYNATLTFVGGNSPIDTVQIPIVGWGVRPIIKYIEQ